MGLAASREGRHIRGRARQLPAGTAPPGAFWERQGPGSGGRAGPLRRVPALLCLSLCQAPRGSPRRRLPSVSRRAPPPIIPGTPSVRPCVSVCPPPRKGGPVRAPAVSEQGPWYPAPLLLPSASFHTRWGRAGFPQPARRQDQPQGSVPSLPSRGVSQGCQAVVNRPRVLHPAPVGVAEVNPASPASFCGKGLPRPSRLR